jgi:polar amino acid transport system permease protein
MTPGSLRWPLLAAVALLLAGCGSGSYQWGWFILDPRTTQGWNNLSFMAGGMAATIGVSVAAFACSIVAGALVAVAGLSRYRPLRWFNRGYVESIRAIPLLVLILWVYYGLPVVLGLQLGILMSGVLQSVPKGQTEAALACGLTPGQVMWLIVLPQAIRRVLPALGNQFIYVLKMSSLLSVIGYPELTRRANELTVTEYRPLEIYTILVVEYLVLVLVASAGVRWMERRLGAARQ